MKVSKVLIEQDEIEQKVKEQEEAEAAAALAMENQTESQQLSDQSNNQFENQKQMQWHFDMKTYQWILIPNKNTETGVKNIQSLQENTNIPSYRSSCITCFSTKI